MKSRAVFAAVGVLALFSVAGCGDRAAEEAAPGSQGVAERAGQAVDQAGQNVKQETKEAAQNTGEAARNAGQAVGDAAQGAAKETQDAAQVMVLTPKVKNALIADEKIKARNLNVDTSGENNTVTITGTVPSEAAKERVTEVAQQALGDAASKVKVVNNVTVAK